MSETVGSESSPEMVLKFYNKQGEPMKLKKQKNKKSKLSPKEIVEKYIDTLEHFFVQDVGGWPLKPSGELTELCKLVSALKINASTSRVELNPKHKIDPEIMSELYKLRYEELQERYDNLYKEIKTVVDKY